MKFAAVVVTYNRKNLLAQCLSAIENQSTKPSKIIVVDNASTDGTDDFMEKKYCNNSLLEYIKLNDNTGGAGGFEAGIAHAFSTSHDWVWIMDDDAIPSANALEELIKIIDDDLNLYGSIAINGESTSWPTTIEDGKTTTPVHSYLDLPSTTKVVFLPFLGLAISKKMVQKIGLPDKTFFIAADDVEYCLRAKRSGATVFVASKSRIHHPKAETYKYSFSGKTVRCLRLPPWKRYYDTRNRILIAKQYDLGLWTKTLPGTLLRTLGALIHEDKKLWQIYASLAGLIDGLLTLKGKRHNLWRIPQ